MWVSFDWSPLDLQPESIALLLLIGHPSHFIITIITINIITFFNVIGIGVSIMDQSSQLIGQVQPEWSVDRFTKTFFWNFQKCRAVLCYILIDKQMLH